MHFLTNERILTRNCAPIELSTNSLTVRLQYVNQQSIRHHYPHSLCIIQHQPRQQLDSINLLSPHCEGSHEAARAVEVDRELLIAVDEQGGDARQRGLRSAFDEVLHNGRAPFIERAGRYVVENLPVKLAKQPTSGYAHLVKTGTAALFGQDRLDNKRPRVCVRAVHPAPLHSGVDCGHDVGRVDEPMYLSSQMCVTRNAPLTSKTLDQTCEAF